MRGRGGWGRGGGFSRRKDDGGVPRSGPITEEAAIYPPNPNLRKADVQLNDEQQCLVALNRIFINYWKFQSPFQVQDRPKLQSVQTYTENLNNISSISSSNQQKDYPSYFPEELLKTSYTAPRFRPQKPIPKKITTALKEGGEDGEPQQQNDDDENSTEGLEDPADFGGDDYAHDHYADEDYDDADDGGGKDDETF